MNWHFRHTTDTVATLSRPPLLAIANGYNAITSNKQWYSVHIRHSTFYTMTLLPGFRY